MKIWTRIALAGIAATLTVNAAVAQTTNANALTEERKEEILARVTEIIQRFAYVPGVDFSRWPEILKAQQERISAAKDSSTFAGEVNRALSKFGASHIVLNTPQAAMGMTRAEFVGIGIQPQLTKDGLQVNFVFPNSPAASAGLAVGDTIIEADGKKITAQDQLRGEENTVLKAKVRKGVDQSIVELQITRKKFSTRRPETLTWLNDKTVAKVDIPSFMVYDGRAVEKIMTEAKDAKAMIVDLRGNGGGQVTALLNLCGYFLEQDDVIGAWVTRSLAKKYTETTKKEETDLTGILKFAQEKEQSALVRPFKTKVQFHGEVIVLVDGATGSASEMFAAAMKDLKKAQVIGSKSAGAVLASRLFPIEGGWMVQYPFQDYITVNGLRLEGNGVTPTIAAAAPRSGQTNDPGVAAALLYLRNSKVISN